jgi:hypothetical protein
MTKEVVEPVQIFKLPLYLINQEFPNAFYTTYGFNGSHQEYLKMLEKVAAYYKDSCKKIMVYLQGKKIYPNNLIY